MKTTLKAITVVLCTFLLNTKTNAQCHIDDWTALKALYESTDGDNWTNNSDWQQILSNSPASNCNLDLLDGVSLDTIGRVDNLILHSNQLIGSIPPELGDLNNLVDLRLYGNQLSGNIPPELGNLSNLVVLWLFQNQFSGIIPPELGNLNSLTSLFLFENQLNGSIPPELGNLINLLPGWGFALNDNNLSGCYPNSLTSWCSLSFIVSDGNNFDAAWEDFCATGAGTCIDDCEANCETDVYPGDLNHDGEVNNQDVALSGLYLNNYGIARDQEHQNIDRYPHPSQNWGFENNQNVDLKHHDCNGDGQLDENDQQAVQTNMGFTWGDQETDESPPESDYLVLLSPIEQVIDDYLIMNVVLERRANADLEVQAGYFTIDYSEIEENISFVTLGFFDESWLGERDVNVWYESTEFSLQNKIDVGFTKTDNVSSNGSGAIGQLILAFDNSGQKKANSSYQFSVSNIGIHNNNAQFTLVENQLLQVNIDNPCQPNWNIDEDTPFQNLYASNSNLTTTSFVLIGAAQEVEYKANRTRLNSGFKVKAGASFKAGYGGCD